MQASTAAQKSISGGEGSLSGNGGGNDPAMNDTLIIFDYPENIERAEQIIRQLDVRPRQVLIEATILAARLTEDMEFGIDWNLLSGLGVTGRVIMPAAALARRPRRGFLQAGGGTGLTVGFSAGNVRAVLTALETITDTTLLANPKILAVNKQEGIVYIGRKIGYLSQTTQTQTSTTQSVSFLETGTRLAFRPYIGDDGYIRMDIYPKDSDGTLKANNIPDETSTELRTNVVVKDGQTVVIGGLFRDSVVTTKSQVPVLGDLPLVGALFRGKKDTTSREEVVMILTPHIIEDPSQTHADERLEDIRIKRDAARHSLEAIDSARIAEDAYARATKYYLEGDTGKALFNLRIALLARPTYLEALRLRERIIAETDPEEFKRLDSIAQQEVGKQERKAGRDGRRVPVRETGGICRSWFRRSRGERSAKHSLDCRPPWRYRAADGGPCPVAGDRPRHGRWPGLAPLRLAVYGLGAVGVVVLGVGYGRLTGVITSIAARLPAAAVGGVRADSPRALVEAVDGPSGPLRQNGAAAPRGLAGSAGPIPAFRTGEAADGGHPV